MVFLPLQLRDGSTGRRVPKRNEKNDKDRRFTSKGANKVHRASRLWFFHKDLSERAYAVLGGQPLYASLYLMPITLIFNETEAPYSQVFRKAAKVRIYDKLNATVKIKRGRESDHADGLFHL